MFHKTIVIPGFLFCLSVNIAMAATSGGNWLEPENLSGRYIYTTDRAVGFQHEDSKRYAGAIRMSPEKERFYVTVREVKKVGPDENWLVDGFVEHQPERCFGKKTVDRLEDMWEHPCDYSKPGPCLPPRISKLG
jgi:hypothetical protein